MKSGNCYLSACTYGHGSEQVPQMGLFLSKQLQTQFFTRSITEAPSDPIATIFEAVSIQSKSFIDTHSS